MALSLDVFDDLSSLLLKQQGDVYTRYKTYVRSLITPAYNRVGWQVRESDQHMDRLFRARVLSAAVRFEYEPALSQGLQIFRQASIYISSILSLSPSLLSSF